MKKSCEFDLRQKVGDLNAICGWKEYRLQDGPASGMRAFDFKNGKNVELTVLADRAFDLPYVSYKGKNMGFTSKTGLRAPTLYSEDGSRGFLRQFTGGMMTTCGITYAGGAGEDGGEDLGLHGNLSNTPASQVCVREDYEGDNKVFRVEGKTRETSVFGTNMLLHRTMTLETERDVIRIHDELENQGFETAPVMMIYHINFGYPMLDEGTRVYTSSRKMIARNETAAAGIKRWDVMEGPTIGRDEECFFNFDLGEKAFAMAHNEKLGIAGIIRFNGNVIPQLVEWKCMRAGDYALGLEPTTSGVLNRSEVRENGWLMELEAGKTRVFDIEIEFTDSAETIEEYKRLAVKK